MIPENKWFKCPKCGSRKVEQDNTLVYPFGGYYSRPCYCHACGYSGYTEDFENASKREYLEKEAKGEG